ncbi:receptor-interacting serine/threonine-protein kinase 3-like [Heteronotia binoei]|uniref:receptor-interacting serine/threonine-protein kinase 3-like n=1 Tax=Heteronotia binoei TaxID=13085 RepID=UPI00293076DB|nr:receptor-interacting serine/threonine-protein kinase 3-like [Heteronotia binoei]
MASPTKFCERITCDSMKDFQYINRGAFGKIYQARHRDWGIDVAVKILNRDASCTPEELLNEALAMDQARFTYILRLFGLFVDDVETDAKVAGLRDAAPRLGLVMEFMENGSLSTLRDRVPSVPWALRLRILHQVALGMNFLHSLSPPLLHLDLKPSNVLLDGELHVRVADFGLSKFKRGTTQRASLSSREGDGYGGTLEYMPPEAFTNLNYKPAPGTDVYSYAILTWSLLTGEEPYPHIHPANMSSLVRILIPQGQRPSTEELEKKIHEVQKLEDLIGLMKRCWHNDRTQRPSFRDCSHKTEEIYCCYKQQIVMAVREVQDILMQMEKSPARGTRLDSSLTSEESASISLRHRSAYSLTPQSFGIEEHFETLRLQESPSIQNKASPTGSGLKRNPESKSSPLLLRSSSMINMRGEEGHGNETPASSVTMRSRPEPGEKKPRPLSDMYPFGTFPPYHPGIFPFQQYPTEAGFFTRDQSLLPYFNQVSPCGSGGIHISGHDISGIQIGSYNSMSFDPGNSLRKKK